MRPKRFKYENLPLWSLCGTILLIIVGILFSVNFRAIISKGDNIPIAGMLIVIEFFTWWAFKQAAQNDEHSRAGERHKIYEDMIK